MRLDLDDVVRKVKRGLSRANDIILDDRVDLAVKFLFGAGLVAGTVTMIGMGIYAYMTPEYESRRDGCRVYVQALYEQITPDIYVDYDVISEECGSKKTNYRISNPDFRCEAVREYKNDELVVDANIEKGDKYERKCLELKEWIKADWKESYLK